jgi:Tannase and feruloyl esterase
MKKVMVAVVLMAAFVGGAGGAAEGASSPPETVKAGSCTAERFPALRGSTIDKATVVAAGSKLPNWALIPNAPPLAAPVAFCRVQGTIRPSATSDVKFEVWLPLDGWNGKFNQVGNGGLGGAIPYPGLVYAVAKGYAAAATDDGTAPLGDLNWLRDPERIKDYGYRAVHETALKAKRVVLEFYRQAPAHSYFTGTSKGGQEGLMEAERYPSDFDGIVAAAPGLALVDVMIHQVWVPGFISRNPDRELPVSKILLLHQAVLKACVGKDGGAPTDRWLTDPTRCAFRPETLLCKGGDRDDCITGGQLESINAIYGGARDPTTHARITYGLPLGSEAPMMSMLHGWQMLVSGDVAKMIGGAFLAYGLKGQPNWNWKTFDFSRDTAKAHDRIGPATDALSGNLRAFQAHGGKLIVIQGWDDPLVPALTTVHWYESVVGDQADMCKCDPRSAQARTGRFVRLFLMPGVGHTAGPGPGDLSQIDEITRWVETRATPFRIVVTKFQNDDPQKSAVMTRPICAYPGVAHYDGHGDPARAKSFGCLRLSAKSR